ncbi:efflux RND transporter periplasmic adaptor subunit [Azohydromonas lata]|uniref:efflux RND transporter periplasmic adaptor subunit n=1 Tax=Azohydromonas lata TaxID=45677 RepID=UPI000B1A67A0|nr:efflux RND transporter periplasmic adaptor subunit [Azohydromonas lata]
MTSTPLPRRLAAALALPLLLAACSKPTEPAPVVPAVYVTPVQYTAAGAERRFSATLAARTESDLAFRTGGKLVARLVDVGQAVRAGQPLARLDAADYQLGAEAAAEQLRAAEVDAAQSASDAARFARLLADGSVGAADQERLQAKADTAAARVQQARRQLELARNRNAYTVLTAPFDGVVSAARAEVGQVVAEGQPVFQLARDRELEVVVDVPEALAADLRERRATVRVAGGAAQALRLRELSPTAAAGTRSFRARYALVSAAPALWRMGMTAEVALAAPRAGSEPVAELPVGALLSTQGQATVWVVDDPAATPAKLTRRSVTVVAQGNDSVTLRGLEEGAWVVSAGAHRLDAGMAVRPVKRPLDEPLPRPQAQAEPQPQAAASAAVLQVAR